MRACFVLVALSLPCLIMGSACTDALWASIPYFPVFSAASGHIELGAFIQGVLTSQLGDYDRCHSFHGCSYCKVDANVAAVGLCLPAQCKSDDLQGPEFAAAVQLIGQDLLQKLVQDCFLGEVLGPLNTSVPLTLTLPSQDRFTAHLSTHYVDTPAVAVGAGAPTVSSPSLGSDPMKCLQDFSALQFISNLNSTLIQFGALAAAGTGVLVTCGDNSVAWSRDSVAVVVVVSVLAAIVSLAYFLASGLIPLPRRQGRKRNGSSIVLRTPPVILHPLLGDMPQQEAASPFIRALKAILQAFNPITNLESLCTVKRRGDVTCFDGIRVMSMMWVIFGHTLLWQYMIGFTNYEAILPPKGFVSKWHGQVLFAGELAVDSFFYLSAFLVGFTIFNRSKIVSVLSVPMAILHRFLRLTPAYMAALLLNWKVLPLMASGPYWYLAAAMNNMCEKYWWTNLLYVNNLHPYGEGTKSECFGHTWYLANDMQFFIASFLFIIPFQHNSTLGLAATVVAFGVGMIYSTVLVEQQDMSALPFDGQAQNEYQNYFYTVPHMRFPSYLVGLIFAMVWVKFKGSFMSLKESTSAATLAIVTLLHVVSLFILGVVVYGTTPTTQQAICSSDQAANCGSYGKWSASERVIYTAWHKPAWCFALGVLTILSLSGVLFRPIETFLSHKAWVPLSRLSYGAYLTHPMALALVTFTVTQKYRWNNIQFSTVFVAALVFSFAFALVLSIVVEKPFMNLEKLVFSRGERRGAKEAKDGEEGSAENRPEIIEK